MSSSKKSACKGTLRQVFIRFIDWKYCHSCLYFRPSFVNCCPSSLLSGSILPRSSLPCVNKYTVYKYTVCRGGGVLGLRQINTRRKVPIQDNFLGDDILHCLP